MRSFDGTVWDPVLRRWVKPTSDSTEHRLSRPQSAPTKAFDIRRPYDDPNKIPDDGDFVIRPRMSKAIRDVRDTAEQVLGSSARSEEQQRADREEYRAAIERARHVGAENHPIVRRSIDGRRSVGELDVERSPGLETLDAADFWIIWTAHEPIQREFKRIEEAE